VNRISLYFDEDAMHSRLVTALRTRGVTVMTVLDTRLKAASERDHPCELS